MRNTLQLVVDDKLWDKLDKAKHVDGLSERRHDERIPAPVGPEIRVSCIGLWENEVAHSYRSEYTVYPARAGMAKYDTSLKASLSYSCVFFSSSLRTFLSARSVTTGLSGLTLESNLITDKRSGCFSHSNVDD